MKYFLVLILIFGLVRSAFSQDSGSVLPEPLFSYQKYALENVKQREFEKRIFEYDSLGNITRSILINERDADILGSLKKKKINDVTTFPHFTSQDSLIKQSESVEHIFYTVITRYEPVNYYLKDLVLRFNKKLNQVDRIEGKLIIHGSNIYEGDYVYDELYVAEFGKVNDFMLPVKISYYPEQDTEYRKPRITQQVKYRLK